MTEKKMKQVMPHLVAGYPDIETSLELIKTFDSAGAEYIEVQIPFSDPLADGPVITLANRQALLNGTTPDTVFRMLDRVKNSIKAKIVVMTYANIPWVTGFENFIRKCEESGVKGLILPDLPYDEMIKPPLELFRNDGVHYIPVVSPGMSDLRLEKLCNMATGAMIYTTLKKGLTGSSCSINQQGMEMINRIKSFTSVPVGAGFGISSTEQIDSVLKHADIAIIGSQWLELFNSKGIKGIENFLNEINRV